MTYRKSDGPFGLLPKKTAMDLEWIGGQYPVSPSRENDPGGHRDSRIDLPPSRPAESQSETELESTGDRWRKPA